jgi:hypothetical protein
MVDYNEYVLLNPNFYKIENQEDFINSINFENYFDKNIYDIYGEDTDCEWRPQLIMNHLCALESQKRVYNMVSESNNTYDFILFIRPDVEILNIFDVTCLTNKFDIIIPSYDHHEGLNDRFAILPFNSAEKYAIRIDEIIEFRKNNGRIVSEKYVKYIVQKYYPNFKCINFIMRIIRPDGSFDETSDDDDENDNRTDTTAKSSFDETSDDDDENDNRTDTTAKSSFDAVGKTFI